MRNGSSLRRQRRKSNGGQRSNQKRAQVYDSNGPDVRIRGTAYQVADKYMNLAKDAAAAGNDVLAQSYLQHAEHYQRIINSWSEEDERERAARSQEKDDNVRSSRPRTKQSDNSNNKAEEKTEKEVEKKKLEAMA